jgi:hypothetical protein
MANDYSAELVTNAPEWNALLSNVERPHIVQTWAYGEAKARAADWHNRRVMLDAGGWRPRRLVIKRRGTPVAICQLLDKRIAGVTTASRLNRGPLFLGPDPGDDVVRGVYGALRGHALRGRGLLVLAPALPDSPESACLLAELGYRPRQAEGWCSDRVDLRPDEPLMRQNLHHKWRRGLRRAEEAGVEVRVCESEEDLAWIIEGHEAHMREAHFVGMSRAFLMALRRAAPRDDFVILQALLHGKRIGGTVAYRFGRVAEGLINWMDEEGRHVDASRHAYWHTALELKCRGCDWFDLGGKRPDATDTFKEGMGGVEYCLLNEWWTI